jgi:flagellar motility protein MotE (MotC chaperone)
MSRWLREVRMIPIALIAVGCLFALKAMGLWFDGGYSLGQRLSRGETITVTTVPVATTITLQSPASPLDVASARAPGQKRSWAQEMFGYPDIAGSIAVRSAPADTVIVTGSVGSTKEPDKPKDKDSKEPAKDPAKADAPQTKPAAKPAAAPPDKPVDVAARPASVSTAERAVLERLLERRQELEAKARELELRENLLKAAEKNLEAKLAALKAKETGPGARKDEAEAARFKSLVTMYETMKPKDAAKVFDRLDIKVLAEVAGQINPRRMSEIMAVMSTEAAEKLTLEFATRSEDKSQKPTDLPKIDGKPN